MLCQNCNKNEATTYYKENINGQTRELHLCPECAAKLTGGAPAFGSFFSDPFFPNPFGSSFFSEPFGSMLQSPFGGAAQAIGGGRRCPTCGMTESELRRTGRAGCSDCYKNFSDILLPYIKKLHGAAAHVGATPPPAADQPKADPVEGLKAKLNDAVKAENYEEAARLRDEIRRLEGEQK